MKVIHTADWHLGDRLRQIDRTEDLHGAIDQVACYCEQHEVDVLVVAGDLFSETARAETFQRSLAFLSERFRQLLLSGMTILGVTGNHDKDVYCELLRRAFQLAAPVPRTAGGLLPNGRIYLATRPCQFRLADRRGHVTAQWVCMPYPTAARYFDGHCSSTYASFRNRNRLLASAFVEHLQKIVTRLTSDLPAILVSHIQVVGCDATPERRVAAHQDVEINADDLLFPWTYVALGHLHRPQLIDGQTHIRYAGSVDRLSISEQQDTKSVTLLELASHGLRGQPVQLALKSTPFYDVRISAPQHELQRLTHRFPNAAQALVRCHVRYRPSDDNLFAILAELTRIFPRCYERTWSPAPVHRASASAQKDRAGQDDHQTRWLPDHNGHTSVLQEGIASHAPSSIESLVLSSSLTDTVMDYLKQRLSNDSDRDELLAMAGRILEQLD